MVDLWMRNKVFDEDIMVLDCGYVDDERARSRAEKLSAAGIGKRNFRVELAGRLFVEIPKTKRETIRSQFSIQEGSRYWGSTHHFQD